MHVRMLPKLQKLSRKVSTERHDSCHDSAPRLAEIVRCQRSPDKKHRHCNTSTKSLTRLHRATVTNCHCPQADHDHTLSTDCVAMRQLHDHDSTTRSAHFRTSSLGGNIGNRTCTPLLLLHAQRWRHGACPTSHHAHSSLRRASHFSAWAAHACQNQSASLGGGGRFAASPHERGCRCARTACTRRSTSRRSL